MRYSLAGPWAVQEEHLRALAHAAKRIQHADPKGFLFGLSPEAEPDARPFDVRGGVAVLSILGPLFRRSDRLTRMLGETAYDLLVEDFREAMAASDVRALVLDIDSPGGDALGLSEAADAIYEARGDKPITAVVRGLGASAAYFIASAADEVVVAREAEVGSIGTVMNILDFTAFLESEGIEEIEIVSSQSPKKRPDPKTEAGRAQLQAEVDAIAQVFVDSVARNRGETAETVLSEFGQGALFVGQQAVDAGLADRVGTLDQVVQGLSARSNPARRGMEASTMARIRTEDITSAWLHENLPEVAGALVDQGRAEARAAQQEAVDAARAEGESAGRAQGAEAERARILGIAQHAQGVEGHDDLKLQLVADPNVTADMAGARLFEAVKGDRAAASARGAEAGQQYLADAAREEQHNAKAAPDVVPSGGEDESKRRVSGVLSVARRLGLATEEA